MRELDHEEGHDGSGRGDRKRDGDRERTFEEKACQFRFSNDSDTEDGGSDTDPETEDEGRVLRRGGGKRGRRGKSVVRFDLQDLEKDDGQYFKDGVGFNFCTFLPDSEYFASYSALDGSGLQILTSSEP